MKGNALDFSFSGLKTAVLRWVEQRDLADEIEARRKLREPVPLRIGCAGRRRPRSICWRHFSEP